MQRTLVIIFVFYWFSIFYGCSNIGKLSRTPKSGVFYLYYEDRYCNNLWKFSKTEKNKSFISFINYMDSLNLSSHCWTMFETTSSADSCSDCNCHSGHLECVGIANKDSAIKPVFYKLGFKDFIMPIYSKHTQ